MNKNILNTPNRSFSLKKKIGLVYKSIILFSLSLFLSAAEGAEFDILSQSISTIREKAESGDPYYQAVLGVYLRTGENGIKIDFKESEKWSALSAEKQNALGLTNMGSLLMEKRNIPKANFYYQEAFLNRGLLKLVENKDPIAAYCLGVIYSESEPKDYNKAVKYFRISATSGFSTAQAILSSMYFIGMGIPSNIEEGIKFARLAANKKSAIGRFNMGVAYSLGQGIEKNNSKAFKLLHLASEQGFPQAQLTLGMIYIRGQGTPKDYTKAVQWFQKAYDQGLLEAKKPLDKYKIFASNFTPSPATKSRQLYQKPQITDPEVEIASTSVQKPTIETTPSTQETTGETTVVQTGNAVYTTDHFSYDDIVPYRPIGTISSSMQTQELINSAIRSSLLDGNFKEAEKTLINVADKGDPVAQRNLGELYFNNELITPDYKKAFAWFKKSAEQGDALSQRYLGMMFFIGTAPERNMKNAKMWLSKAAAQGDIEAEKNLQIFERVFAQ